MTTPYYTPYDRITIPTVVPELGVSRGDSGLVEDLALRDEVVPASVRVDYSTGQPRGWVGMAIRPDRRVLSFYPA